MTLKPGAIRYQEKYWHIIHQMKFLKENWIISIKQLKCSIYYCNLRENYFSNKGTFFCDLTSKRPLSEIFRLGETSKDKVEKDIISFVFL